MTGLTLAIETSNPGPPGTPGPPGSGSTPANTGSVCLGHVSADGEATVVAHHTLAPASRHDDALMPAVALVCERAGISPSDLSRVAVSLGPGGFTSVRVAVTTAKMIAEATRAACIPVPTALALAHAAVASQITGTIAVLLAWKREDVWRQRFRIAPGGQPAHLRIAAIDPGTVVPLDRATADCDTAIADAELSRMLTQNPSRATPPTRLIPPAFDAKWVLAASHQLTPIDPAQLLPIYPREPEAVTKWRVLHPPR